MLYANYNGIKTLASKEIETAMCSCGCGAPVIPKCGLINSHHWALVANTPNHISKPETDWHREWKSHTSKENVEIQFRYEDGSRSIADMRSNRGRIIELQHSPISREEVLQREDQYKQQGLIWVIDISQNPEYLEIENDYGANEKEWWKPFRPVNEDLGVPAYPSNSNFFWKFHKKAFDGTPSIKFLDVGMDFLFHIKDTSNGTNRSGKGSVIHKSQFIEKLLVPTPELYKRRLEKMARAETFRIEIEAFKEKFRCKNELEHKELLSNFWGDLEEEGLLVQLMEEIDLQEKKKATAAENTNRGEIKMPNIRDENEDFILERAKEIPLDKSHRLYDAKFSYCKDNKVFYWIFSEKDKTKYSTFVLVGPRRLLPRELTEEELKITDKNIIGVNEKESPTFLLYELPQQQKDEIR